MPEPTKPVPTDLASKWDAYIAWLAVPDADRKLRGLPTTKTAFAATLGVSARMLNKYEADPRFTARLAASGSTPTAPAVPLVPAPVPVDPEDSGTGTGAPEDEDLDPDEADYRAVKAMVIAGARKGDPKMIDQYYKTYGRPFVEDEAAARHTDLANMDMADLVARAVLVLAPAELAAALSAQGWTLTPPTTPED